MTEQEFNKIKTLLNAGITPQQVEEFTGRSTSTTHIVQNVNTWLEFKKYRARQYRERIAKEARDKIEDKKEVLNNFDKSRAGEDAVAIVKSYTNMLREVNQRLNDIEKALVSLDDKIPARKKVGIF